MVKKIMEWIWRRRMWSLTVAIIILAGLSILLGSPALLLIIGVIIAILINILTSYTPSKIRHYSKVFDKYTQIHIERLKEKILKSQEFYIYRKEIEKGIRDWIEENKNGCAIIIGDAGSGKTNLLCNLATEYLRKKYAVLFIESDLLENFKSEKLDNKAFSDILLSIKNEERKKVLLLFDTLDLIAYNRGIRKLSEFIADVKGCDESIIIGTIRFPEYENIKDKIAKIDKTFFLDCLTEGEIKELFRRYNKEVILPKEVINFLTVPLYVHMFIEVYEKEEIPSAINFIQLYEKYWEKKVQVLRDGALSDYSQKDRDAVKSSKVDLVYILASIMFQNKTLRPNKIDFLREIRKLEASKLAYNDLISEHILIEHGNYIEFFHQTFFEYAVARHLIEARTNEEVMILIEKTDLDITFYSGIFEYLALLLKNRDKIEIYKAIVDKLYRSPSHFQRILLINLLSHLSKLEEFEIKTIESLISKDMDSADYMLGLIISEIWMPKDAVFTVLEEFAYHGFYRIKRRITEALPGLILRDIHSALKLMRILRDDYDKKWKTDNRRRVVEAVPYLIKTNYLEIDDFLRIRDDDEFYVVIAIVEVLNYLKSISPEKTDKLTLIIKNQLNNEQVVFVTWLLKLLEEIMGKSKDAIEIMKEVVYNKSPSFILETGDDVYRISVSRNLPQLLIIFPNDILEMMSTLIKPDEHANVRRPLVRQARDLIEFMLKEKVFKIKVEEVIWSLAIDNDEIIPITFFDNFPYFIKVVPDFSKKIIDYYLNGEGKQKIEHFTTEGKLTIRRRIEEAKQELESIMT